MPTDPAKNGPDTDLKLWKGRIEMDLEQAKAAYKQLRHTVYGNGKPGLDEVVRRIEGNQEGMQKEQVALRSEIKSFHDWFRGVLTGTVRWGLVAGGGVVLAVVVWAIRQGAMAE